MPRKSEKINIAGSKYDRRIKLTEEDKDRIRSLKGTMSINAIAREYQVDKRTIQFILFPERLQRNIQLRQERGGSKLYYDKYKHREAIKEHRQYKQDLYLKGEI